MGTGCGAGLELPPPGGVPDGAPDHRADRIDGRAGEHARGATFRAERATSARCRSGSGQHLPDSQGGRLPCGLAPHLPSGAASSVGEGSLSLLGEGGRAVGDRRSRGRRGSALRAPSPRGGRSPVAARSFVLVGC